jgi:hypothetical protein
MKRQLIEKKCMKLSKKELVAMLLDSDYFRYELEEEK